MNRTFITLGSFLAALAVALGAFGAHALESLLLENSRVDTYDTGSKYHFYHAIAIILTGILYRYMPGALTKWAAYLFMIGILLFSFSLYALSVTNIKAIAMITPFGGFSFVIGWFLLGAAALKRYPERKLDLHGKIDN